MQEEALDKVKKGLTTLQEIRREVAADYTKAHRCSSCGMEVSLTSRYCSHCGAIQSNASHAPADDQLKNGWSTATRT